MVNWRHFVPTDFEYDFDKDKLAAHRITFEEAVECFSLILKSAATNLSVIVINSLGTLSAVGT